MNRKVRKKKALDHNNAPRDLLATWDLPEKTIFSILVAAQKFRRQYSKGTLRLLFRSGMAVSLFRDHSTRTRYSFRAAADMLGLSVQEIDEDRTQVAHGETVHETYTMLSYLTRAIGIRDDIYLGKGHTFMQSVRDAVADGYASGVLPFRPTVVNLQSDVDHPTQSLSDLLHLVNHFGGIQKLRRKKFVMSWAYSPTYGKPLSVPQGVIGLLSRFGMDLTLAYPSGYNLIPETEIRAKEFAAKSGGSFRITHDMDEAFKNADIVYPKSWAPYNVMERRTRLLTDKKVDELKLLEKECLRKNAQYKHWTTTEAKMQTTNNALYMHCLPADVSGVSCKEGEVDSAVFERFRNKLYMQAGYKPYIIAAAIALLQS